LYIIVRLDFRKRALLGDVAVAGRSGRSPGPSPAMPTRSSDRAPAAAPALGSVAVFITASRAGDRLAVVSAACLPPPLPTYQLPWLTLKFIDLVTDDGSH
jgi:hypothetical protein